MCIYVSFGVMTYINLQNSCQQKELGMCNFEGKDYLGGKELTERSNPWQLPEGLVGSASDQRLKGAQVQILVWSNQTGSVQKWLWWKTVFYVTLPKLVLSFLHDHYTNWEIIFYHERFRKERIQSARKKLT